MCDPHDHEARVASDQARGTFRQRGYKRTGHAAFRDAVLLRDNACRCDQCCDQHNDGPCLAIPTVADHWPRTKAQLMARGLDSDDPMYGRALCKGCHDRHSGRSQGRHGYRSST